MWQILWAAVEWGINKFSDYKLKNADNALERERISSQTEQSKDKWKAVILTSTGAWMFQLFFIVPLSLWFFSVVLYSIFLCQNCVFPQTWTIAALPSPLNDWAAIIIAFLFLANTGRKQT